MKIYDCVSFYLPGVEEQYVDTVISDHLVILQILKILLPGSVVPPFIHPWFPYYLGWLLWCYGEPLLDFHSCNNFFFLPVTPVIHLHTHNLDFVVIWNCSISKVTSWSSQLERASHPLFVQCAHSSPWIFSSLTHRCLISPFLSSFSFLSSLK